MPLFFWLATFFGSLFTSLITFFFNYMTKRLALVAAVVVTIGVVTLAFFAAMLALMASVIAVAPPFLGVAISLVLPHNFVLIVSISLSARALRWVYEWNVKVIQYRLF